MTRSSHALPRHPSSPVSHDRTGSIPGRWDAWNRLASGVLIAAIIIAIGAGAWRIADDRDFGTGTEPSATTGVFGLDPTVDGAALATPEHEQAGQVVTPVEQLPGIESAVLRSYSLPSDQSEPPSIPNLFDIGVSVYRFDNPDNAAASYDLLVANVTEEFTVQTRNNAGYTLVTADLSGLGERGNLVRLDFDDATGNQSQENVLTLHDRYVFAVVTLTGGPYAAGATPPATADPSATAIGLATTLVANGQPSPDEAIFYEDGTSTGGDWGFMPAAGDPLLAGLVPIMDQQLYPANPNASGSDAAFPPDPQDLTGIQAAVYREYASADMFFGSQTAGYATPMTEADRASTRYRGITIWVYQLDNEKNASVAYDRLSKGLLGSFTNFNQGGGQERLVSEDLTGIGDQATRSQLTLTSTREEWIDQDTFQYITVQRGDLVFVIAARSGVGPVESLPATSDQPDPMIDLATQIVRDGQVSPDEPVYAENGTSTGGLWGIMPPEGDPLLMGLVPLGDFVLYPVPER